MSTQTKCGKSLEFARLTTHYMLKNYTSTIDVALLRDVRVAWISIHTVPNLDIDTWMVLTHRLCVIHSSNVALLLQCFQLWCTKIAKTLEHPLRLRHRSFHDSELSRPRLLQENIIVPNMCSLKFHYYSYKPYLLILETKINLSLSINECKRHQKGIKNFRKFIICMEGIRRCWMKS